jgi:hypothetical protein
MVSQWWTPKKERVRVHFIVKLLRPFGQLPYMLIAQSVTLLPLVFVSRNLAVFIGLPPPSRSVRAVSHTLEVFLRNRVVFIGLPPPSLSVLVVSHTLVLSPLDFVVAPLN